MSDILERLADVVESRKAGDPEKSYVSRLFARGPDAILKKEIGRASCRERV